MHGDSYEGQLTGLYTAGLADGKTIGWNEGVDGVISFIFGPNSGRDRINDFDGHIERDSLEWLKK